jgi:cyclomaltodextrinase / maltogenic alpha-amylase / neopullulanase
MKFFSMVLPSAKAAIVVSAAFFAASCAQTTAPPAASTSKSAAAGCKPNPFGKRDLYLRGSFNSWTAEDKFRFAYTCDRFELVAAINGKHEFKVADDDWSKDADFGRAPTATTPPWALTARGSGIEHNFNGTHRFTLNMTDENKPTLSVSNCPAAPFGETTLYLRGGINNWVILDEYAFEYRCDAYYLNVSANGLHEFKIGDVAWTGPTSFGAPAGRGMLTLANDKTTPVARASDTGDVGHFAFDFNGEHTLKLALVDGKPELTIGAKSFASSAAKPVTNKVALSLRHDSRNTAHKAPFGAITAGSAVEFSLDAVAGVTRATLVIEKRRLEGNQEVLEYTEVARIPMQATREGTQERWRARHTFAEPSIYGYYFEVEIGNETFIYQNNRDSIYWTREKGSNGLGIVEEVPPNTKRIRRLRVTVFDKNYVTPDWARDVVYYYIFPERFRNGNPANDPKVGVTKYHDKQIEFHQNWLDKPYRANTGDGSDPYYNNDFFGGDLAGIIEKLDYIKDLGANTIYMTPIFHAVSNHKYDTADYKKIDPHFGTNEDFSRLTAEAQKRGIRVLLDTSLNHTGSDSIYFDRFGNFKSRGAFEGAMIRKDSPYASWYTFNDKENNPENQYTGWVGVRDLPEINKASPSFREFAFGAKDSVMKMWLDRGAAGWRMDVAPWVPDDFWRPWRSAIKQHKPDALTIAETHFDSAKFFLGDTFDGTMNYIFRNTVLDYAGGAKAPAVYHNMELMRELYPPQSLFVNMNLISSHDVPRALYEFGYVDDKASADVIATAKQRVRLATFMQMTLPGAPAIYYGDEVGLPGGPDPFNRAGYPWADKGGKPDLALLADMKKLTNLRAQHAVLRRGSFSAPAYMDDNVIAHVRVLKAGGSATIAVTATNNSNLAKTIRVPLPTGTATSTFVDALTGGRVEAKDGAIEIVVPAMFGVCLVSK